MLDEFASPPPPKRPRTLAAEIPIVVGMPPTPRRAAGQPGESAEADVEAVEEGPPRVTGVCESPLHTRLRKLLGKPSKREQCFGCAVGRKDSVAISLQRYNELTQLYQRQRLTTDPPALARQMSIFFEQKIRQPANREAARRGLEPIPEWRPIDVYLHFHEHISEASARMQSQLDQLHFIRTHLFQHVLYQVVVDEKGEEHVWPRPKMLDQYIRVVRIENEVRKGNVSRMFGYAADSAIDVSQNRNWINTQRPFFFDDLPAWQAEQQSRSTSGSAAGGVVSRGRA
jgi:hypothetical protein